MHESSLRRMVSLVVAVVTIYVSLLIATDGKAQYLQIINTSKTQYDVALAKWNSLHVEEYEETVQNFACRYKAVLRPDPSNRMSLATMLSVESLGPRSIDKSGGESDAKCGPFSQSPPFSPVVEPTVEELFFWVNDVYTHPDEEAYNMFHGFAQWYSVEFDPEMGYPRQLVLNSDRSAPMVMRIESVKIMKTYDQP